MKKLNKIKFSLLVFMIGIMNIQAQELALGDASKAGYEETKAATINLKALIKKLEPMYKVSIVCNSDLVHTKIAYEITDQSKSVEEHLSELTAISNLSYHKLDEGFYVINTKEENRAVKNDALPVALTNTRPSTPVKKTADKLEKVVEERISGTITSEDGETLPGVNVLLKGTNIGTVTDMDGKYAITVPNSTGTLVFSFIGFSSQEIAISGRSIIDVTMVDESQALGEVVVTAFGLERKKESLVYSVTEVRGEEFTKSRETNLANSLTGKIAGVNATSMASGPGSSSRVVIRGNGSLNGNNQPLYVINGMPISNSPATVRDQANGATTDLGDGISSINPDDIESMSVLKGGAAAALYGSQAANGVILITTKKGARQKKGIGIELNSNFTLGTINIFPEYQYEYGQGSLGVRPQSQGEAISTGRLSYGEPMDGQPYVQFDGVERPYSGVSIKDNIKAFYRNSTNIVNTVSFSGGNESVLYRVSVSDLQSGAIVDGSTYDRQTANVNLKAFLSDKLSFDTQVQYNYEVGTNRPGVGYVGTNSAWGVYLLANTVDITDLAPGYNPETGQEVEWQHVNQATNPYFARDRMGNKDVKDRVMAQGSLTYDLLPNLFIKADFMRDFSSWREEDYYPVGTAFRPLGTYRSQEELRTRSNGRLIANYNVTFGNGINLTAMVGGNLERDILDASNLIGSEYIIPDWISPVNLNILAPSKGFYRTGTNSVFSSLDFNLKETFYLSITGRQDQFSTLNPGNNKIFYPSVGGSVILSNAFDLPDAISFAKLRGSWAQVGSATVDAYAINQLYGFRLGGHLGVPVQTSSSAISNPELRPLTSTTSEIGFDAQFFDNRFGIDFTLYSKINRDDIVSTSIAPSSGATSTLLNVGEISNKGIELLLTGNPIRTSVFSWNVSYNLAYNKNRVLTLAPGQATGNSSLLGKDSSTRFGRSYEYTEDGIRVYNSLSGYAMLGPTIPLGIGVPPYTMGFENTFTYKNFSLNALIDAKFGNKFFSQAKQYMWRFGLLKETLPGRDNGLTVEGVDENGDAFSKTWPASFMSTYYNNDGQYATNFMIDGSFVKLRSVVLNYNIPVEKLKFVNLTTAQLSLVARNLAILYRNSDHFDPEQGSDPNSNSQNFSGVMLPRTREIGFNLRIGF